MKFKNPRVPDGPFVPGRAGIVAAVLTAFILAPVQALAQSANAESVEGRPRPEYDPLGIYLNDALTALGRLQVGPRAGPVSRNAETLGSFIFNSTMELETAYDDNVYRKPSGQVSDTLFSFKPGLRLASDWNNHSLALDLGGNLGRYLDTEVENFSDFNAGASGKVDIDEGESATLGLNWSRGHQSRDSLDNQNEAKPTTFQNFNFSSSYSRDAGDIFSRTTVTAGLADFFDNGSVNNDDRDVWTYALRQRFGHEVDEGSQIFVEGAGNYRDYSASVDDNRKKLGSHGYEGLVGLVWDVSGISFLEFGAGYFQQNYKDPTLRPSKGPSFRGRFLWNPTGLLTLSGNVGREVAETQQTSASAVVVSTYSLKLDWEALYNLILSVEGSLQNQKTGGTNREDDTTRWAFRWRWLIGQNWSLRGAAEYAERQSTSSGSDYKDMRFSIAIVERL